MPVLPILWRSLSSVRATEDEATTRRNQRLFSGTKRKRSHQELMQLSQPTLEPHSLCYTCRVQVVYSPLPLLYFFLLDTLLMLSSCRHEGVHSALPGLRGLLGVHLPVDVPMAPCFSFGESLSYFVLRFRCIRHFVIIVINKHSYSLYYVFLRDMCYDILFVLLYIRVT